MKTISVILLTCVPMFWVSLADGQEALAGGPSAVNAATAQQPRPKVRGWRYKWHNGHWWYYQPNNQWLFWNGASWSPYSVVAYQTWWTNRGPHFTGYRGTVNYGGGWYGWPGTGTYTWDPYAPYNTEAMTPSAHLGQAMSGGMSGPEAARVARVGENN
jgi:hypothetical protein